VCSSDLSKIYDNDVKAVDNASLKIDDGEFAVLIGPSGCGKSTLLRMIAGLEVISEGEVKIADKNVNLIPSKDRNIAMVFQNYALYPHMTVYQNMAFGLKLRKYNPAEIEKRVNDASEILDLGPLLKRKPKQLSGGQRQRVAVGRAIVRKPDVFLFDEPLSNLDAKLRVQMRLEISKLHKKLGATMIYVTHDQIEAMTMADRIVILNNGQIQQIGTPLETYNKPINKFVAGFIGSPAMNFFEGTFEQNEKLVFKSDDLEIIVDKRIMNKIETDNIQNVILGIRPENLKISDSQSKNSASFLAMIEIVEPMGNEFFVHCIRDKTKFTIRCNTETILETGQKIKIVLNEDKVHFFDKKSGMKI